MVFSEYVVEVVFNLVWLIFCYVWVIFIGFSVLFSGLDVWGLVYGSFLVDFGFYLGVYILRRGVSLVQVYG